jgi:hypothetical protein
VFAQPKTGLGNGVVKALAKQLVANVVALSGASETTPPSQPRSLYEQPQQQAGISVWPAYFCA